MRSLLLLCALLLAGFWLVPATVGASDVAERAEMLEKSLQAVEWYTNESVRKALQAEQTGDNANATLFGNKAIESDLKAQGLRQQTADAWLAAGKPARAQVVWRRAADMARERGDMLANRIPVQWQLWQDGKGRDVAVDAEREKQYLLAVFFTAQHWDAVAQFSVAAGDAEQQRIALAALQQLLPPLQRNNRLAAVLVGDSHEADYLGQLQRWQQRAGQAR